MEHVQDLEIESTLCKTEAGNLTKRKYVIVSKGQSCRFLNKVPTSVRRQDIIVEIHKFFGPDSAAPLFVKGSLCVQ